MARTRSAAPGNAIRSKVAQSLKESGAAPWAPPGASQTLSMSADEYLEGVSEHEFQTWVVGHARENGWLVYYIPDWMHRLAIASIRRGRRGDRDWPDKGFPDVWCVHPIWGRLRVFELKSKMGSASTEQKAWVKALTNAGVYVRVFKPKDRMTIRDILEGKEET